MTQKESGVLALTAMCLFLMASVASAAGGGILQGNYSIYKDGKIAANLTGKNPMIEDSLLVCNGKCVINSHGISLVAAQNAIFAVRDQGNQFNLLVKQGKVDFALLNPSRKIGFYTPDGGYTVGKGIVKTSVDSSLRGFMQVENGKTEVGLYDGSMVFTTAEGIKTVNANEKIILAMAEIPGNGGAASEPVAKEKGNDKKKGADWWSQNKVPVVASAVVLGGTAIGLGLAFSGDDNDHHKTASPSK